ncbi:MAG: hypothetical protein ACE5EO_09045 [Candidatus Krumholzibacteriia bacterium]
MKRISYQIFLPAAAMALAVVAGCAKTVMVPPRVDLDAYRTIGFVAFSSNSEGNLAEFAGQKFLETLQSSQAGVRVLELGPKAHVLASVRGERFDHETIRAIGERYHVEALIVGHLEVTDVKPTVDLSAILATMSVSADVEASLTTRLYETDSGATAWTNSVRGKKNVAHVGITPRGPVRFGADDPEDAYGKLVNGLVYANTRDFRVRFVKQ